MSEPHQEPLHDLPSRVSRLETVVDTIHEDLMDLKKDIRNLSDTLSQGGRTNWTMVFAGVALIGGLYAAAVRPMTADIERQDKSAEKIATAVLLQNEKISTLQVESIKAATERSTYARDIAGILRDGAPPIDKRLSILEYKVGIAK